MTSQTQTILSRFECDRDPELTISFLRLFTGTFVKSTMKRFSYGFVCLALLLASASARSAETNANTNSIDEQSARSASTGVFGDLRYVYQVYKDCSGSELSSCLKLKLLTAMERVSRNTQLNIVDGVTLVKDEQAATEEEPRSLQEIEASLPRSLDDREDALNSMIMDKIVGFFQSHTLKLKLPNIEELQRSLSEEGKSILFNKFKLFFDWGFNSFGLIELE